MESRKTIPDSTIIFLVPEFLEPMWKKEKRCLRTPVPVPRAQAPVIASEKPVPGFLLAVPL